VLLADEPVASLDPRTARGIMQDLKRIQQDEGILTIVNLHSIELAQEFADRIIGLRDGRIVFDGPARDVTVETLAEIYGEERLGGAPGWLRPRPSAATDSHSAGSSAGEISGRTAETERGPVRR